MGELWKFLTKGPTGVIAWILAAVFFVLARFEIGLNPYSIHRSASTDTTTALIASAFFLVGSIIVVAPHLEGLLPWRFPVAEVLRTAQGFSVAAGGGEIRVLYGKLDELVTAVDDALV